jgi:hypothetical protein
MLFAVACGIGPRFLHRVRIEALREIDGWATCEEIARTSANFGRPVRKYNTNRALKTVPEFAERSESARERLRYTSLSEGSFSWNLWT